MTDDDVERVAKALALDMYPDTRWPDNERDANSGIDDRQGRAPVSWHFANKCRSQARVAVNLLSGHTPSPPSSSEPVGIDLSEFPDLPADTRISIRIVSGEMAGTEIDNVPFSVFIPAPVSRKKPDWRDPFCKRRDENVLSNIRDAYFYGFEDALEIVGNTPTPAARAEPAWKPIEWGKRINFPTEESMVLIRKGNGRFKNDGEPCYNLDMAYKTVSNTWLTAASQPVGSFEEWCEIPK